MGENSTFYLNYMYVNQKKIKIQKFDVRFYLDSSVNHCLPQTVSLILNQQILYVVKGTRALRLPTYF